MISLGICILLVHKYSAKGDRSGVNYGLLRLVKIEIMLQISPILDEHVYVWPFIQYLKEKGTSRWQLVTGELRPCPDSRLHQPVNCGTQDAFPRT